MMKEGEGEEEEEYRIKCNQCKVINCKPITSGCRVCT